MKIKELFERVSFEAKCNEQRFLEYFNEGADLLVNRYSDKYALVPNGTPRQLRELSDESDIEDPYYSSLADYILYRITLDDKKYESFLQKSDDAYRQVWRKRQKRKQVAARLSGGIFK